MTVALKLNSFTISKSNQSLGGDDYFFALLTSFPSIYPAPPHKATRASNVSKEIVTISNFLPSVTTAQFTISIRRIPASFTSSTIKSMALLIREFIVRIIMRI